MSLFPAPWGNYMLKEIVETTPPENISWWPQTIAWKIIGIVLLVSLIRFAITQIKRYQSNAYRREAIAWLEQLPRYQPSSPSPEFRQLPALIKKVALIAYGRTVVNQVPSEHWATWLDQQCPNSNFSAQHNRKLLELAYAPEIHINSEQMTALVAEIMQWVKGHGGTHA